MQQETSLNEWHYKTYKGYAELQTLTRPEHVHNRRVAIKQRRCKAAHNTSLDIQRQLVMIDGVAVEGRQFIILVFMLQKLYNNHINIEKARLLAWDSIYWLHFNAAIEEAVKSCLTWREYQKMQPKNDRAPWNSWQDWSSAGPDIFTLKNNHFICITDYHN